MAYIRKGRKESLLWLLLDVVGTWSCEGAPRRHCHVRVGIGSLRAASLVDAIAWHMRTELSVHVPAELLSSGLRVVELFLGGALQGLKLILQNLELLLSIASCTNSLLNVWVHLSRLLCNRNH